MRSSTRAPAIPSRCPPSRTTAASSWRSAIEDRGSPASSSVSSSRSSAASRARARNPEPGSDCSSRGRSPRRTAGRSTCTPCRGREPRSGWRFPSRPQAADAQLLRELLRAFCDPPPQVVGLEQDSMASVREDLAHDPVVAGSPVEQRVAVAQRRRTLLDLPPGHLGRVEDPHLARALELAWIEALATLEPLGRQLGVAHAIEPEAALAVARPIPRVDVPEGQSALEEVRLDGAFRPGLLALLLVLDLDEAVLADRGGERLDECGFLAVEMRLARLGEVELAEGLHELLAHLVDRGVRVRGDSGADEIQREVDRARLERRQPRRRAERVPVELLVDAYHAFVEFGVDRVAAAAEVDEIQQGEVIRELIRRA